MRRAWLGIDLGTSSVKCLVLDEDGLVVATAQERYGVSRPRPGWAEQDPEQWWQATIRATRAALAQLPAHVIVSGVGLSGQMHGVVLVDAADAPVRPAIIWADSRAIAEVADLREAIGDEQMERKTGFRPATGMAATSLLWLRRNEPQTLDTARFAFQPKDYIRLRLTGIAAVEPTDAGASLLFALGAEHPDPELTAAAGIDPALIPSSSATLAAAGAITDAAAAETGIPVGVPVAAGGSDQAMAALALGLDAPERAAVALSSGGTMIVPAGERSVPVGLHTLAAAEPGNRLAMGVVLAAGLATDWVAKMAGSTAGFLLERAGEIEMDDALMALGDLGGTRTPIVDDAPQGAFSGLGYSHEPAHLMRATVESVAISLADALRAIDEDAHASVVLSGGGTRFQVWRQAVADATGRPVIVSADLEHSAIGAALTAASASGATVSFDARSRVQDQPVHPDPRSVARLDAIRVRREGLRATTRPVAESGGSGPTGGTGRRTV